LKKKQQQLQSKVSLTQKPQGFKFADEQKTNSELSFCNHCFHPIRLIRFYKRSGFIHPLSSPGGEVLSRIQAPDHYHHYGIWGPWTKTTIDGRSVDFWNLMAGEGTVKFIGFLSEAEGAIYSGFQALQQHVDFGAKGEDQIAMNEILDVRAWNIGEGVWMIDYTTSLNSPLKNGIMLDAYRYGGGIGFRPLKNGIKTIALC
jgi:hypothetical protein